MSWLLNPQIVFEIRSSVTSGIWHCCFLACWKKFQFTFLFRSAQGMTLHKIVMIREDIACSSLSQVSKWLTGIEELYACQKWKKSRGNTEKEEKWMIWNFGWKHICKQKRQMENREGAYFWGGDKMQFKCNCR